MSDIKRTIMAFILLLLSASAHGQAVLSLNKVNHIRTESFDIYYPDSLAFHAVRLASFADSTLKGLEAFFEAPPLPGRLPVLLTDISTDLNGYSTPYPSNRIVILLASSDPHGALASASDELYFVFLHELTHTVTLNLRAPLWTMLSKILGDFVVPVSWIAPNALVEGTAVWVESNPDLPGNTPGIAAVPEEPAVGSGEGTGGIVPGRLNDPAALEPVFLDIRGGKTRNLWDVSGVADSPGSGDLPYLYGALFSQFMVERYGLRSLAELWHMASSGNIFEGFDGTLVTDGMLGELTGISSAELWKEFLAWLEERSAELEEHSAEAGNRKEDPILAVAGKRVGAFAAGTHALYYVDLEKQAVFSIDWAGAGGGSTELGAPSAKKTPAPKRLFPADGYIERLSVSEDEKTLTVDWIRFGTHGEVLPARYTYDVEQKALTYSGDIIPEPAGSAQDNLENPGAKPFLYGAQDDSATGFTYGLIRLGAAVLPARRAEDGTMEVLESSLPFVRSLSILREASTEGTEGDEAVLRIALGVTPRNGIARLALLEEHPEGWRLYVQKEAPKGGVHDPVLTSHGGALYSASLQDGRRVLCHTRTDTETLSSDYESLEANWLPLDKARQKIGAAGNPVRGSSYSHSQPNSQSAAGYSIMPPRLFPGIFATARYPYVDQESAGLHFEAQDLTERLSWAANAGWNFRSNTPEAALAISLAVDRQNLSFAVQDGAEFNAQSQESSRISSAVVRHSFTVNMLPVYRRFSVASSASFSGIQDSYSADEFFSPAFTYAAFGGRAALGYSSIRSAPFAPFDEKGLSATGGIEYENLPGIVSALSFSGSMELAFSNPPVALSAYAAFSPETGLQFLPAGRVYSLSGQPYASSLAASYPVYREYSNIAEGGRWYLFGEAKARIADFEAGSPSRPVKLPFLPSFAVRRVSLWGGFRGAMLESNGDILSPSSAFLRVDTDAAVLAGLAAEGHVKAHLEGAWIFKPSLAGNKFFNIGFGLEVVL